MVPYIKTMSTSFRQESVEDDNDVMMWVTPGPKFIELLKGSGHYW